VASQVETVNRALFKLGASPITSIDDNSKAARIMGGLWDTVRRAELSKRFWVFAMVRAQLPALATAPEWQFGNAYQLPPDFLKLVQVADVFAAPGLQDYRYYDDSPWAVEGTKILTDFAAPLKLRYVADVTDPGQFDATFVEVMASKLAYEACYAITQSREGQNVAMQDYKEAVRAASLNNAILKPPQGLPDDSWTLGRL
jgi:hypothetical protein